MRLFELLILLVAVAGALRIVSQKWGVPHPSLLVIGGAVVALIPGLPQPDVDPNLLFTIFVPPLLFWSALTISLRELHSLLGPVLRLATGLVIVTMGAVAAIVHLVAPGVGWPEAFVLGAIVSPPDPVAATAVLRPLGAPRDTTTLLEGEGLINDATALVAYRLAVAAVVAGSFSLLSATWTFALTGGGGALVGLAIGWLIVLVRKNMGHIVVVENALSLLSPFLAYLPAEALHTSGVLAVVTMGLYLGTKGPRVVSPETRLQATAMWSMVTFLLESLIFMLVGLELPRVIQALHSYPLTELTELVLAATVVCIVVRFVWVLLAGYLGREGPPDDPSRQTSRWKKYFFVAWAGLRGADSLVIALALPLQAHGGAFPNRDLIIFVTFGVIFMTLVVQGFSLAPLVRKLGLASDGEEEKEERLVRIAMADAALVRLRELARGKKYPQRAIAHMRLEYRDRKRTAEQTHVGGTDGREESDAFLQLRREMHGAEREELIKRTESGEIGGDVMRHVQRHQDVRDMLLSFDEEAGLDAHELLDSGENLAREGNTSDDEDRDEDPG